MWKLDTKSAAWMSLDTEVHLDLFLVSLYPSQITLYKSLHICQWLILESTIWVLYLDSLSIITGVGASCVLLEKELDMVCSSIDTWKTR